MATVTKTFTETGGGSTWTVTVTGTDQTVSGNFNLNIPTVTAKYVYSAKNYAGASVAFSTNTSSSFAYNLPTDGWSDIAWASNATKTITNTSSSRSVTLSTLFNASNKTSKTANITATCDIYDIYLRSYRYSGGAVEYGHDYDNSSSVSLGTISTITLDAPPTVTLGTPTYSTPHYAGLGTYSVPVTTASAQYGGDIASITLTVGADSVTQTYSASTVSNQTLSVTPSVAGTYTPTIAVTDSRGQTKTESLAQITVGAYTVPSVSFDVFRANNAGVKDDEGTYGLIKMTCTFVDAIANMTAPTITIVDSNGTTISATTAWYSAYNNSTGISSAISNWSSVSSGNEIYGLVNGSFSGSNTYQITITETDSQGGTSQPVTQALSTAFYTIDFQAGGKEIAFGAPANNNLTNVNGHDYSNNGLFRCHMHTLFEQDLNTDGDINATNVNASGSLSLGNHTMADFIVEEGTSGNWTYRKWNSGKFEAWLSSTGSTGSLTQLGSSGIYYSASATITFPSIGITSVEVCEARCYPSANYFMYMTTYGLSTSSVSVVYIRYGSSASVSSLPYSVHIVGTWS